ncbi:DEAD/DEAH box helicase, partial [uncultured Dubosiella sp.]
MIAKKKMSTLILVHTREILQGWVDALEQFLVWEDALPQYTTPFGRKKTRKSHIGVLYGGKDTCSRKVDVAIISSVLNKEEKLPFLDEYGMVIMDECHHIPSKTYEQVIQKIPACCRYGFSATPKRKDGQDPKIFMYFGPVRYRFSAKERAIQQGILHVVVPRYTSFFVWNEEQQTIQEAYRQTIQNQRRNDLIIQDIKKCLKEKRTPLVLSRFRSHAQYLYRCLEGEADHVFLLQGGSSAQERETIRSGLKTVPEDESLILIAVDKYIGEGFNYPRLDTLFLTTPFKSDINVEQYAGRLNRDHSNKEKVIIYDYVDHYVGYFRKMYHERIRAYKKIGYIVSSGIDESIHDGRSVYDHEGYVEMLRKDLEKARSDVVLCTSGLLA